MKEPWKVALPAGPQKQGIMAGMIAGFLVCVGWKLAVHPLGLSAAVPGVIVYAVCQIDVSLATCKKNVFRVPVPESGSGRDR